MANFIIKKYAVDHADEVAAVCFLHEIEDSLMILQTKMKTLLLKNGNCRRAQKRRSSVSFSIEMMRFSIEMMRFSIKMMRFSIKNDEVFY